MPQTVYINEEGLYDATPTYLFDHADLYKSDPHMAGLTWFREAHYGLGIKFGLHSLLGKGHDVLQKDNIGFEAYNGLLKKFNVEHFDPIDIVEFAIANGMRYIDFTVCGPDGFCLWNSDSNEFNCFNGPVKRDLLAEMSSVCEYNGVGLCLTYSHGCNWHHPHSDNSLAPASTRDFNQYMDFVELQVRELLTKFGPIAALNLEGIEFSGKDAERYRLADMYKMCHFYQPQMLVSYQQGITGEEDFFTAVSELPTEKASEETQGYINKQLNKPCQVCETLTPGCWGYNPAYAGMHRKEDFVLAKLTQAGEQRHNFLVSTALMPDGSLDYEDITTLLEIGKRIESNGFPSVK